MLPFGVGIDPMEKLLIFKSWAMGWS